MEYFSLVIDPITECAQNTVRGIRYYEKIADYFRSAHNHFGFYYHESASDNKFAFGTFSCVLQSSVDEVTLQNVPLVFALRESDAFLDIKVYHDGSDDRPWVQISRQDGESVFVSFGYSISSRWKDGKPDNGPIRIMPNNCYLAIDDEAAGYINDSSVVQSYFPEGFKYDVVGYSGWRQESLPFVESVWFKLYFTTKLVNVAGLGTYFRFLFRSGVEAKKITDVVQRGTGSFKCAYISLGDNQNPLEDAANVRLLLNYSDQHCGVLKIGSGPDNRQVAYLKDRPAYNVWTDITGDDLSVYYDVETTNKAVSIEPLDKENGLVDFGASTNPESIFYHYNGKFNGSQYKQVYYQSNSGANLIATARSGSGLKFVGWVNSDTLELVSKKSTYWYTTPRGSAYSSVSLKSIQVRQPYDETAKVIVAIPQSKDYGSVTIIHSNTEQPGVVAYSFNGGSIRIKAVANTTGGTHGYFVGWYKGTDGGALSPVSKEHEFDVPEISTGEVRIYRAWFRQAQLLQLNIASHTGGSVVVSESAGKGSGSSYYEGPMRLTATANSGYVFTGYKVNDGELIETGGSSSFDIDFSQSIAVAGGVSITPVFSHPAYKIDADFDSFSVGKGGEIQIDYTDPDEQFASTSGENISALVLGDSCITVTISAGSGNVLSRVVQVTRSEERDITDTFVGGAKTFTATQPFALKVYLGAVATVAKSTRTQSDADGGVEISLTTNGPWHKDDAERISSVNFEYGKQIFLHATDNDESLTSGKFISWHLSSDVNFTNPIQGAGKDAAFTPASAVSYVGLFGAVAGMSFIHITNNNNLHGSLSVVGIEDNTVTQYDTYAEFCEAVYDAGSLPPPPSSAGASRDGDGTQSLAADDSQDKYYGILNGSRVIISVNIPLEELFVFSKFGYVPYRYAKRTGTAPDYQYELQTDDSPDESDMSQSQSFEMVATGVIRIVCHYKSNEPRMVYAKYASGSSFAMGALTISPWPPFKDPWPSSTPQGELGGKGGAYRANEEVTIAATPNSGYSFSGWYDSAEDGDLVSIEPNYTINMSDESPDVLEFYAKFEEDTSYVYEWEGNADENLRVDWRSKRFANPQPVDFVAASVCADGYPNENDRAVNLTVHHASSPNAGYGDWRDAEISVCDQAPRRLPMCRPERYVEVEVKSNEPVLRLAVSTSMGNLISQ